MGIKMIVRIIKVIKIIVFASLTGVVLANSATLQNMESNNKSFTNTNSYMLLSDRNKSFVCNLNNGLPETPCTEISKPPFSRNTDGTVETFLAGANSSTNSSHIYYFVNNYTNNFNNDSLSFLICDSHGNNCNNSLTVINNALSYGNTSQQQLLNFTDDGYVYFMAELSGVGETTIACEVNPVNGDFQNCQISPQFGFYDRPDNVSVSADNDLAFIANVGSSYMTGCSVNHLVAGSLDNCSNSSNPNTTWTYLNYVLNAGRYVVTETNGGVQRCDIDTSVPGNVNPLTCINLIGVFSSLVGGVPTPLIYDKASKSVIGFAANRNFTQCPVADIQNPQSCASGSTINNLLPSDPQMTPTILNEF